MKATAKLIQHTKCCFIMDYHAYRLLWVYLFSFKLERLTLEISMGLLWNTFLPGGDEICWSTEKSILKSQQDRYGAFSCHWRNKTTKIPELRLPCLSDCSLSVLCLIMFRLPFGTHLRRKPLMGLSTCKLRQSGSLCVKSNKMQMICRRNQRSRDVQPPIGACSPRWLSISE